MAKQKAAHDSTSSSSGSDSDSSVSSSSSSSSSDNDSNKKRKLNTTTAAVAPVSTVHPSRQSQVSQHAVAHDKHIPKSNDTNTDLSCIIFISSLNPATTEAALTDIFSQYGTIKHIRLLLNRKKQSRGLCYIEYNDSTCAHAATQHTTPIDNNTVTVVLSNKPSEFVHAQPKDTWIEPPKKLTKEDKNKLKSEADKHAYAVKRAAELGLPAPTKPVTQRVKVMRADGTWVYQLSEKPVGCTTVYVTNLSYNTTEDMLRSKFEHCGEITYLNLCRDKETQKLKGYAYVQYSDGDAVDIAVRENETELCGRMIRVDYARPLRERYSNHATYKKPQVSEIGKTGEELRRAAEERRSKGTFGDFANKS